MRTNFTIYQVNPTDENSRNLLFSGLRTIKKMNLKFNLDMYKEVYNGSIEGKFKNWTEVLEEIYCTLNINRPEDFKGHSLSTSDIVKINDNYYFCDSFGWQRVEF